MRSSVNGKKGRQRGAEPCVSPGNRRAGYANREAGQHILPYQAGHFHLTQPATFGEMNTFPFKKKYCTGDAAERAEHKSQEVVRSEGNVPLIIETYVLRLESCTVIDHVICPTGEVQFLHPDLHCNSLEGAQTPLFCLSMMSARKIAPIHPVSTDHSDSEPDSLSDSSSSGDVTEDEHGDELTPALDAAILRTLGRIKRGEGVYGSEDVLSEALREAEGSAGSWKSKLKVGPQKAEKVCCEWLVVES